MNWWRDEFLCQRPIFQAKALEVDADLNAICDFILEAADWAAELSAVPLEKREVPGADIQLVLNCVKFTFIGAHR
jgi:hypothetical protein